MGAQKVDTDADPALTIAEIGRALNVSRPTVYQLVRDDPDFPVFRVGARLRMRKSALEKWIRQREKKEKVA